MGKKMPDNNFDGIISELQDNIIQINAEEAKVRIKNIDFCLNNGKLDMSNFSLFESTYVHSKLHFFYHMTNPPIDKSNIISMHKEVIKLIPEHQDFDYLDKNNNF